MFMIFIYVNDFKVIFSIMFDYDGNKECFRELVCVIEFNNFKRLMDLYFLIFYFNLY